MDNQVIHIYGASGAGTSTLGKFICTRLGNRLIPLISIKEVFHTGLT